MEEPTTTEKTTQCHLLLLPAELRLCIYQYALTPTNTLSLSSDRNKRFTTTPIISPNLLATCRQIHNECSDILYSDNEICLSLDAHDTCWPVIAESRLPQCVLEKIQRMCMVFDCTSYFQASYEDVDFTALTALTSLKSVRLAFMYEDMGYDPYSALVLLLEEVLMRLPKRVKILCEIEKGSEQAVYLEHAIEVRKSWKRNPDAIVSVPSSTIELAVAAVDDGIRGTKNGTVEYVFAEHRDTKGRWVRPGAVPEPDMAI